MKRYSTKEKLIIIMLSAMVASALTFGGYVTYKQVNPETIEYTGGF